MKKFMTYGKYLARHKWFVFVEMCKIGRPFAGLMHDMSKLRPSEFIPYMHHFGGGIQAGRNQSGYYKPEDTGDKNFDRAWFFHQKRNDHHWQYWTLPKDDGTVKVLEMPLKARQEMMCDWQGASKAQKTTGTVRGWYTTNNCKMLFGPETKQWIEEHLFPEKKK